jgi:tRNA (mo5U34)-methyltransferase
MERDMHLNVDQYLRSRNLSTEDFQRILDEQSHWFHRFEFTNGCVTRGHDPSAQKLAALSLPPLDGKTVADVGAFDGYFSFQAEMLGAAGVTAIDHFVWMVEGMNARRNFELIREAIGSKVSDFTVSVETMRPENVGTFDVTLFLGVLYHAPNMAEYLHNARAITKELLIVETLVDMLDVSRPAAAYYPSGLLNNDPSNWWGPNIACVADMLKRVGFGMVEFKGLWHLNTISALRGATTEEAVGQPITSGRAVFHAYV